jgi:hypothetical protein
MASDSLGQLIAVSFRARLGNFDAQAVALALHALPGGLTGGSALVSMPDLACDCSLTGGFALVSSPLMRTTIAAEAFAMKKTTAVVILGSVAVLLGSVVTYERIQKKDEPTIDCITVNGGSDNYKLLVVGESWACSGHFFPELPNKVSDRLGGRGVRTCSLCFSGRNSRLLNYELRDKFPKNTLYEFFGGHKPNKVILMNGVNDEIEHVGSYNYSEYTNRIVAFFSDVSDVEVITIPRVNEINFRPKNTLLYIKRLALRCFYDNCRLSSNDDYRSALRKSFPDIRMIEYDRFIKSYVGNEGKYAEDGIHLTDESYHKYGTFIGDVASISSPP